MGFPVKGPKGSLYPSFRLFKNKREYLRGKNIIHLCLDIDPSFLHIFVLVSWKMRHHLFVFLSPLFCASSIPSGSTYLFTRA